MYRKYTGTLNHSEHSKKDSPFLHDLACIVSYNKYGAYCIPQSSKHRPAAQMILADDVYEQKTIDFMRSHCAEGDIIHAGTFFGDFLPALSESCGLDNKIWTFEPNPESYRCASITILLNGLQNIELTNSGLSEKSTTLAMQTSDEQGLSLGGSSVLVQKDRSHIQGGIEMVQVIAIDMVVPGDRTISIIQLDVEGHEQEALTGGLNTIRRCLPIIILEVLASSNLLESEWFAEHILSLGYQQVKTIDENAVFICSSG